MMDRHGLYIYWRIAGAPLAAFVALTILCALLFQYFYLKPVLLESETLKELSGATFGVAVLGSLAVVPWVILHRHRVLLGRPVSTQIKTMLIILFVVSLLGFLINLAAALEMLIRIVRT